MRLRNMNHRLQRALVVLACVTVGVVWSHPASADCSGPQLSISKLTVASGSEVVLSGRAWGTACNDTGGSGPVLGSPARGVEVVFVQGGTRVPLGEVSADSDYRFVLPVEIPAAAVAGPATIEVGPAPIAIVVVGSTQAGTQRNEPKERNTSTRGEDGQVVSPPLAVLGIAALFVAAAASLVRSRRRSSQYAHRHAPGCW